MIKDNKIRKRLIELLPSNYRQIISEKLECHVNTVSNVLHGRTDNPAIEVELFSLAKEEKEKLVKQEKTITSIAKQL